MRSSMSGLFAPDVTGRINTQPVLLKSSENHNLDDLITDLKPEETCVFWYVGAQGFKHGSVEFYRSALTDAINAGATPFLVDLSAWAAFSSKKADGGRLLEKHNEIAASLDNDQCKTLRCSEYFKRLSTIQKCDPAFDLIADIISRENLRAASLDIPPCGVKLGQLFKNNCPAIAAIYDLDSEQSYSVMQYIELLFLVEMILLKKERRGHHIKFMLPNDESKYYLSTIAEDLTRFLSERKIPYCDLKIDIACFKYSENPRHRPYNAPGATIKPKDQLTFDKIIDTNKLKRPTLGII